LKQRRVATVGGVILVILYLMALFAGFVAPYSYDRQDRDRFFHPPTWPRFSGFHLVVPRYEQLPGSFNYRAVPNDTQPVRFFVRGDKYKLFGMIPATIHLFGTGDEHYPVYLLGTDQFGRDVLSRLLYGSQISLSIGIIGILLSFTFGMIIGGISGYFSGWTDTIIMRLCELIMSIPALYLIISLRATFPPSMSSAQVYAMIIIILSFIGWASMARVIRGMTLSLREQQFVLAARALDIECAVLHFGRSGAELSGCGHSGAECQLGQHADRRAKHRVFAELSVVAGAGCGDFYYRSRFQLSRRWIKRRGRYKGMKDSFTTQFSEGRAMRAPTFPSCVRDSCHSSLRIWIYDVAA
jgi:ABC-type dipeptide/oligopeptide/nickel transport system permease subunit